MFSPALHVLHDKRRGTARIEYATLEPLWRFRASTGEVVCTIRLQEVTDITVLIFTSERMALALSTKERHFCFFSTTPADVNWDAALTHLRTATRGHSRQFRAPFSTVFPPIEFLRGPSGEKPAAKKRPLTLFNLPQELLDITFGLAYPTVERIKISTYVRKQFQNRRRLREGDDTGPMPSWSPKVDEFMVSRRFFEEAARAWVRNQHFHEPEIRVTLESYLLYKDSRKQGVLSKYIDKLSMSSENFSSKDIATGEKVLKLPSLLDLRLIIVPDAFGSIEPLLAWKTPLTEKELETVAQESGLATVRGLKHLEFVPCENTYARSREEHQLWKDNVKALESYLFPIMTQDRSPGPTAERARTRPRSLATADPSQKLLSARDICLLGKISEEGLLLNPVLLQSQRLGVALDFIKNNSSRIVKTIEDRKTRRLLATLTSKMAALSLEGHESQH